MLPWKLTLLLLLQPIACFPAESATEHNTRQYLPQYGITLEPESERSLDTLVLGLEVQDNQYYGLPELPQIVALSPSLRGLLEAEFYGLTFELTQGAIMRLLPEWTQVYIAVPDPAKVKTSFGHEIPFFKLYLEKHCGWSRQQILKRVHFFKVPDPLIWSQDAGEILGHDDKKRVVIGSAAKDDEVYRAFLHSLVKTYPGKFRLWEFPADLSAEGGDENMVWLPEGKIGFVLGHNRVIRYLDNRYGTSFENQALEDGQIEEAKKTFSQGMFGVEILILPEKALRDTALADLELFHLDMLVSFLSRGGRPQAFVPTFEPNPMDRISMQPLDPKWVEHMQAEFDLVADELRAARYDVFRLPFSDHPVRSPVNLLKYYDPQTDSDILLLAKYPYHLSDGKAQNGQALFNSLVVRLGDETLQWRRSGNAVTSHLLEKAVEDVWKGLFKVEDLPNPLFDKRAAIFKALGYHVVPLPMFPCGAGSIHCMTLH